MHSYYAHHVLAFEVAFGLVVQLFGSGVVKGHEVVVEIVIL